jgi:hypothetical protein
MYNYDPKLRNQLLKMQAASAETKTLLYKPFPAAAAPN